MYLNIDQKNNLEAAEKILNQSEKELLIVGSWLPLVPGFYNSWCEYDDDRAIEDLYYQIEEKELSESEKDELKELVSKELWSGDAIYEDVKLWKFQIAENFIELIKSELSPKFILNVEFEEIKSPKEYNFVTDSINCKYTLSEENIQEIKNFINENYSDWKKYLENHYKSYDGFSSYYSYWPESEDWKDIAECLSDSHKCGSIMQFISEIVIDYEYYGKIMEDVYTEIRIDQIVNELLEKGIYCPEENLTEEEKELRKKICNERLLSKDKTQGKLF